MLLLQKKNRQTIKYCRYKLKKAATNSIETTSTQMLLLSDKSRAQGSPINTCTNGFLSRSLRCTICKKSTVDDDPHDKYNLTFNGDDFVQPFQLHAPCHNDGDDEDEHLASIHDDFVAVRSVDQY